MEIKYALVNTDRNEVIKPTYIINDEIAERDIDTITKDLFDSYYEAERVAETIVKYSEHTMINVVRINKVGLVLKEE